MKQWLINRKGLILVVLPGIITYTAGFNFAMLSFILIWQTLASLSIFNTWKEYLKTKKGIFVKGRLIESAESRNPENIRYELLLEFCFPLDENKYQLKHYSDLWPMSLYKIWVDTSDPQKSIVVEDVNVRLSKIFFFGLIVSGLFYIDYLYLLKILLPE